MQYDSTTLILGSLAVDFLIQFLGFVLAAICETEKFYDITGSFTYLFVVAVTFVFGPQTSRGRIASFLSATWALRLGTFLFLRVMAVGKDIRFDEVKHNPCQFSVYWFMQGIWVFFTILPVILVNSIPSDVGLQPLDYAGIVIWTLGFLIETTADIQKSLFKRKNPTTSVWIDEGLWSISRHPNYFGEITVWVGMYVLVWNGLSTGTRAAAILSPAVTTTLLCFVSGIPILEKNANAKWGHLPEYQKYRAEVSVLVPLPRGCFKSSGDAVDTQDLADAAESEAGDAAPEEGLKPRSR